MLTFTFAVSLLSAIRLLSKDLPSTLFQRLVDYLSATSATAQRGIAGIATGLRGDRDQAGTALAVKSFVPGTLQQSILFAWPTP